jgi:hypothetical protein
VNELHAERAMRNRSIDWDAVERDYRAGRLSLRQLGQKHRCSHSTIANFASRHGWRRDGRPCDIGTASKVQSLTNSNRPVVLMKQGDTQDSWPGTPYA